MTAFNPGVLESLVGLTMKAVKYQSSGGIQNPDAINGTVDIVDHYTNLPQGNATVVAASANYVAAYDTAGGEHVFASFGTITLQFGSSNLTYTVFATDSNGLLLYQGATSPIESNLMAAYGYYAYGLFDGGGPAPTYPLSFDNDAAAYVAPCFAEGSRLLTARGEVAVEDLVEGDEVVTAAGGLRPVIWIGSRRVRCDRHPRPHEVNPVRVRAGAFGDGLPVRDLRLSPGHAVAMDGALLPVSLLVNGATIVQEPVESVRYFHVELDAHDVILAEGLACESYLDDGNRETFGNAPGHLALYGRLDPQEWDRACLPVLREGPQSEALRQRLLARALDLGWTQSRDLQLTLDADGQSVAPVYSAGSRLWFLAPAARTLRLLSPAAVQPPEPARFDPRPLGVAVSGLRVDGEAVDLASETLGRGFHGLEHHAADGVDQSWRWTDGAAELPATSRPTMIEVEVLMVAPRWIAPDQTLNQASPLAPRLRLVEAS